MDRRTFTAFAVAATTTALLIPAGAMAQTAADFYKGKTVSVFVGVSPGGIYSSFAQLLARHMGKHIPGQPTVIVKHMPGAGGTKAVNFVYNVAPKDGTAVITPNAGIPKKPYLKIGKAKYDPTKMHWVGGWGEAINTVALLKPSPVSTLKEAMEKEVVLGAIGKTSNTFLLPAMMNNLLGTKFKIIPGYRGGSPVRLAIEKREVAGWAGQWLGWKLRKPDWVRDGKLVHLVQLGSRRAPDLPDVPLLTDFAKTEKQRAMFSFVQSGIADRALALPPGVPADRVAAIGDGYQKTLRDPAFLTDAKKSRFNISPVSGAEITKFITDTAALSASTIEEIRAAMGLTQ
jgi:tripartite-type tricarboxylate transporter receptor subunit TctC